MDVKVYNVGFGESILISDQKECLLVDCGSEMKNSTDVFNLIISDLNNFECRSAMITHFHQDHINGFMHMANSEFRFGFDTIYIPKIFAIGKHPNPVDLEIIRYLLERWICPQKADLTIWELLKLLCRNNKNITLLERGNTFKCFDDEFEVLWPKADELVSKNDHQNLINKFSNLNDNLSLWDRIKKISESICKVYLYLDITENYNQSVDVIDNFIEIERELDLLTQIANTQLDNLLSETSAKYYIKALKKDVNKMSIVCQGLKNTEKSILLTGDIPSNIFKKIALNHYDKDVELNDKFWAIKVPHHGTEPHYFNFDCVTEYETIIISNGVGTKNRLPISCQYILKNKKIRILCTNTKKEKCECINKCDCCNINKNIDYVK